MLESTHRHNISKKKTKLQSVPGEYTEMDMIREQFKQREFRYWFHVTHFVDTTP